MKIYSIEINNLGCIGMMLGSAVPNGSLGVVVDDYKFEVYERLGCAIWSRCGEIVHIYQHAPGTKEGFGGSKIKLRIKEPSCMFPKIQAARVHTFKGDLWDGATANKIVADHLGTKLFNVGIKKLRDRNSCFWAGKVTEKFMETLSKAVILGQPEQGDFSEDLKEPSHE